MDFRITAYQREVLEKGDVKTLNLVFGEEEYLIRTLVDKLREKFGNNLKVLWGDEISTEDLLVEASESSLFSPSTTRSVVIMHFDDLVRRSRRRKRALEELVSTLKRVRSTKIFAVVVGKLSQEDLSKEPYRTFAAQGDLIRADRLPQKKVREIVKRKLEREAGGIDEDALDLILEICGSDLTVLRQEVEKLIVFSEGGRVTRDMVSKVCAPWEGGTAFDLLDAVFSRDVERILKALRSLERSGIPGVQILAFITSQVLKIYTLALSVERGGDPDKVLNRIGVKHSFARAKMKSYLKTVSSRDLETFINRLYSIDRSVKVFFARPEGLIEDLLITFALR